MTPYDPEPTNPSAGPGLRDRRRSLHPGYRAMDSHQSQIFRRDARKHLLHQFLVEPVGAGEQAAEQGAVIRQHRIVAVLEQRGVLDLDLLAGPAPTFDGAPQHPIDAAVALVGALVALLPEGAAEF